MRRQMVTTMYNNYGYLQDAFGTWSTLYLSHDHMLVKLFSSSV